MSDLTRFYLYIQAVIVVGCILLTIVGAVRGWGMELLAVWGTSTALSAGLGFLYLLLYFIADHVSVETR